MKLHVPLSVVVGAAIMPLFDVDYTFYYNNWGIIKEIKIGDTSAFLNNFDAILHHALNQLAFLYFLQLKL